MDNNLQGIVVGKVVELSSDPGFTDGQAVEVVLRPLPSNPVSGSAAGLLSDLPDPDSVLETIENDRKMAENRSGLQ